MSTPQPASLGGDSAVVASAEWARCACRVYVIAAGVGPEEARQTTRSVLAAWPGRAGATAAPRALHRSLADVTSGFGLPTEPTSAADTAPAEVVLILASGPAAAASARRALASAVPAPTVFRPTLVLVGDGPQTRVPASSPQPGEACVELPWSTPAPVVAGVLAGLAGAGAALREHAAESALQAQIAVTAARQIEEAQHELHLAGQLQRELLPAELPAGNGLELAAMYRPGSTLSGDFYDAVRLNDHTVGLLLADACGHGVPAALLVMLVSKLLPMTDTAPGGTTRVVPPAEALARLNDAFIERRGVLSALISAAYAVIDTRTWTATVSSAGHPPAILARPHGPIDLIADGGPLLGVTPGAAYAQRTLSLAPGATLLLSSDGFEHAFGLPADQPTAAPGHVAVLASVAQECPQRPLHAAVQGLDDLVLAQRGSLHQIDDITLLAARRTA